MRVSGPSSPKPAEVTAVLSIRISFEICGLI
jgi:hypothetical protein